MNKIIFPLKMQMQGEEVADLQEGLRLCLDNGVFQLSDAERQAFQDRLHAERIENIYAETTQNLVEVFQKQHQLQPGGSVDEPTAKALNAILEELGAFGPASPDQQRLVGGQVRHADNQPFPGALVRAFDVLDDRGVLRLGEDTTDAEGRYTIRYAMLPGVDAIDLRVVVFDADGKPLRDSDVIRGAKPLEIVDLTMLFVEQPAARVSGIVRHTNGTPLVGALVSAYDKDLRNYEQLGEQATTGQTGRYEITYTAEQFSRAEKGSADLTVRVIPGPGMPEVSSTVIYNAQPVETVNVTVGGEYRGPSEYDELIRELTPARQDVPLHELTAEDVTFLAGDTGQDAQRITWLAESAKRHQEADNIFPQVFYALFRQNLPTELRGLLANDLDVLRRALETSSHDNIIVDIRPNELEHIMANLQQLKVNYALKPAGENKRASLGDLLTIGTTLNTTQQEALADLFVTFKGPAEELWKTATERGFTDQQIADVQSMLELGALTMNHTPLVRKLHQMKPPETGASLRYLADLDKEQWRKLVEGHPVPAEILGETLEEKQNSYAENLQRSVEEFYPTAVIASRIRHDKLPVDAKMRPHLETFFGKNPEFEFGSEYVETYLASNKANLDGIASAVRPGLEHTLLQLERLTKITNHANEIGILLQEEFDSSYRIVSLGKRDFIETMSEKVPGGRVRAETLYDIAEQNISISVALLARYGQQFNSTDVPVLPQQATNVIPAPDPAKGLPDLRILFGNLDFCNCEHCRSVYSPAAYLVDVLQFLKNRDSNLNDPLISRKKKSIRDILFERRPDIAGIELTCENTNVPVPYIDLVNEILENAVSSPTSLPIYQTKRSAEELAANPEYLNIAAYDNFLKQAKFPWSMPFDLWLEEARIYLDYIKSGRVELMETVRPNARFTDNTIAREQLKLSKEDAEFITKANPQNGWTYWGFQTEMVQDFRDAVAGINRSGEWDTLLSNVSLLRQQSGLAYGELLNLLDARYIQTKVIAGQPLTLQGDECNQGTLTLSGLNDTILDRAHRCARLWRRLNWPMYDLDRAINAGSGEIDDEFLLVLSHIERLRDALGVSVATAASWFANIDTQAYIDHTKEGQPQIPAAHDLLFQNRTVLKEADPDFALKSDRTDLVNTSDKITNHTATVIAALGISTTDLTLLIEEGIPDTLGLANLSQLYRAVSLAKALKLSIRDFLTVKKITGITPFPTHPPKISDASRAILEFIEEVQQIRRSGFAIAELDYLLRDRSNVIGGIAPSERLIALVLGEIRDGLQRIARETEIVPDSEGQFLRKSLTLLGWNSELIEQALSAEILGSDLRFEIELLQLPGDPAPSALPTRVPEKFGYDSARKRLFCLGAMRTSEKNKLSAAFLTTAVNFAAYETAVNNLFVLSTANAPTRTDFIKEKMQSFELPTHSAQIKFKATLALGDLPIFPGGVSFVDAVPKELKPRISYNAGTQELVFTGFMTIGERDKLINLAPGASRYGTVIENIYKIRITIPKELTGRFYYDMGDLSLHFVGWMTEAERQRLRGLSTEPSYRAAIDELDQESSNYTEQKPENIFLAAQDAEKLFFDTTTVGKRFEIILNKLMTYLRKRASENLVVEIISRALAIEVQTARLLLLHYMKWPGRSEDAMVAFLDSAFAVSDTKVALTFATFADQFATFALLAKVAQLISRLQVTAAEISWLFPNGADRFNLNNLHAGSSTPVTALYEGWRRLIDLFRLRDTWPGGSNTLSIIFGAAADVGKSEKDLRDLLVEHIGWNASDLEYATGGHTRTPALPQVPPLDLANAGDYGDERKLGQLRTCIDLLKRLGGSAQQIWAWAGESLSEPDARAILQTVRAKFDNATWLERARPLRNVLRERQRAALVDYLVARDQLRQAEDLFGQYLIDVEMSPCQLTSRIKQATNSVQLFVQRCLMNLEQPKISPGSIDLDQWKWMKNYRVWEANRKVFVYPENLIQPELRDDKSPFFRDLEGELQQGDITDQTATSALHNYLEKLDQVARLEIVGMYVGLYNEDEGGSNVLHVFGRTYNTPHIYFYRKLVDSLYWTPWEKVDLDIEGDHLIPVAWHGRLYLFWPIFTEQAKDPDPIVEGKKPAKFWDIQLAWSEKHDDKWSGKQIIPGSLELSPSLVHSTPNGLAISPVAKSELNFRGSEKDGRLVITCRYNIDQTKYNWVMLGQWFFAGNQARSTIIKNSPSGFSIAATPPDSRVYNMMYREREREELGQDYTFALPVGISDEYQLLVSKNLALLAKNPDIFCILYPHQVYDYLLEFSPAHTQLPFFYQDNQHTYFVWRPAQRIDGQNPLLLFEPHFHANVKAFFEATREGGTPELFSLKTQYRPDSGKGKVFGIEVDLPFGATFVNAYEPNFAVQSNGMWSGGVLPSLPNEDVSFSPRDAYSLYNWELFFHIPLLIATRLNKNQRFADAQSWFHSIFDPIGNSNEAEPARFWRFRPFYEHGQGQSIQELMKILADKTNTSSVKQDLINRVYQWRKNPFKPHAIARWRIQSYEWAVVMKYIDNLIEWGDQLFRRETIEAINEAAQLYILAAQILGKRPERILRQAEPQIHTYTTLEPMLDTFSNALVKTENLLSSPPNTGSGTGQGVGLVLTDILYFCIPHNDKLVEYWDKVSDRLFKIRHCMTIEGAIRQLPLFDPAIDPALLVRAAAAGVDISSVLSDTNAPIPHYRFNIILQKANELCNDVKSLGSSLLSALEKRDAEALALLRSRHEMSLMEVVRHVKELQVEEAKISLEGLGKNLEMAQSRLKHYCNLLSAAEQIALPVSSQQSQAQRLLSAFSEFSNTFEPRDLLGSRAAKLVEPYAQESLKILQETLSLPTQQTENEEKVTLPLSSFEKKQLTELKYANEKQKKAMDFESLAQVLALIPDFTLGLEGLTSSPVIEASIGGTLLSTAARLQASNFTYEASDHSYRANLHSILAGYQRRAEEWLHQAELVLKEIEQIAKQIEAAGLRLAITTREIKNHDLQVKNTQEVDEYLRDKYTNQELYDWMVGQISGLYFQSYQLAYDVAKRAERTYRFELGVTESNFIQFGYWDSLKKGLLSGEKLQYDLRRLEINYLELNRREFELTKYVSLVLHSPMALITLKQTGRCEFELPEELFDADYPGHFMRRIKSVSITVPCVTGPYTNVNCTLTLLKNSVRKTQSSSDPYSRDDTSGADLRFADNLVAIQSIVTSSANNESGVFEVNLRDERYLPFEGAGAISQWRIDLPKECNAFDFDTLSDVVLHLKYTAREGGDSLKGAAKEAMQATIAVAGTTPLARLFSAKHEFPTDWHRFMHPADPAPGEDIVQKLPLALTQERFPFQLRGRKLQVDKMHLFLKLKEEFTYKEDGTAKEKFTYDDDKPLALVLKEDGNALPVSQFLKGGSPISDLPYAEPLKGQSGKLGQWPLEVKEDEVKKIDASLQQKVKINGQDHVRLHPDAIEDVWIVCEYQVLK